MVPRDCYFYVYCANIHVQRKISIFYINLFSKFDHGRSPYKLAIIVNSQFYWGAKANTKLLQDHFRQLHIMNYI